MELEDLRYEAGHVSSELASLSWLGTHSAAHNPTDLLTTAATQGR